MKKQSPVNIIAINGSARPGNYTGKVLALLVAQLRKETDLNLEVVEAADLKLDWKATTETPDALNLKNKVAAAAGIIFATPEYQGSFSAILKLIIENLGYPSVLSGKPVVLLGVASGRIGAVKALEHLRSICASLGALALPATVSVAEVHKKVNAQGECLDPQINKLLADLSHSLVDYIRKHVCPKNALDELVRELQ